jgi:hypothetical protein
MLYGLIIIMTLSLTSFLLGNFFHYLYRLLDDYITEQFYGETKEERLEDRKEFSSKIDERIFYIALVITIFIEIYENVLESIHKGIYNNLRSLRIFGFSRKFIGAKPITVKEPAAICVFPASFT